MSQVVEVDVFEVALWVSWQARTYRQRSIVGRTPTREFAFWLLSTMWLDLRSGQIWEADCLPALGGFIKHHFDHRYLLTSIIANCPLCIKHIFVSKNQRCLPCPYREFIFHSKPPDPSFGLFFFCCKLHHQLISFVCISQFRRQDFQIQRIGLNFTRQNYFFRNQII